jgi:hypothetical protein
LIPLLMAMSAQADIAAPEPETCAAGEKCVTPDGADGTCSAGGVCEAAAPAEAAAGCGCSSAAPGLGSVALGLGLLVARRRLKPGAPRPR